MGVIVGVVVTVLSL